MKQLQPDQLPQVIAILKKSFNRGELRTTIDFKQRWEANQFCVWAICNEQKIQALSVCWEINHFLYIEYLCVTPNLRNVGLGSLLLGLLTQQYAQHTIVLEASEIEDEETRKRVLFYERNGFYYYPTGYKQPALHETINEHLLHVMSYPKPLLEKEYKTIKESLFDIVYEVKG